MGARGEFRGSRRGRIERQAREHAKTNIREKKEEGASVTGDAVRFRHALAACETASDGFFLW